MIQAIPIQASQNAAVETANVSKTAGGVAGGFETLLKNATQALSGATGSDPQAASKAKTPTETPVGLVEELVGELVEAQTLSTSASKPSAQTDMAALPAQTDEDPSADASTSVAGADSKSALEAGLAWLPVMLTAPAPNDAPTAPSGPSNRAPADDFVQAAAQPTAPQTMAALTTQTQVVQAAANVPPEPPATDGQVKADDAGLQNLVAAKACAATVTAVPVSAAPDVDLETSLPAAAQPAPAQPAPAQPAPNPDLSRASAQSAAVPPQQASDTAPAARTEPEPGKAAVTDTAAKQPTEITASKVSGAETSRPSLSRSTILSQGATDPFVDTLLRADLNTGAVQTGATLPGNSSATPLANDQGAVRQALLDQTRQGIEAGLQNGKTSLHLRLTPEDLGGIDLRVTTGPQGASVLIRTENPATGRLLEQNLSDLRQALQDAGVQLNNLSVGQQAAQNGQFTGQNPSSQLGMPNAPRRRAAAQPEAANTESSILDGVTARRTGASSKVNVLV